MLFNNHICTSQTDSYIYHNTHVHPCLFLPLKRSDVEAASCGIVKLNLCINVQVTVLRDRNFEPFRPLGARQIGRLHLDVLREQSLHVGRVKIALFMETAFFYEVVRVLNNQVRDQTGGIEFVWGERRWHMTKAIHV